MRSGNHQPAATALHRALQPGPVFLPAGRAAGQSSPSSSITLRAANTRTISKSRTPPTACANRSASFAPTASSTCTTCHNPHDIPRGAAATLHYNAVCGRCHTTEFRQSVAAGKHTVEPDCVDLPHAEAPHAGRRHAVMTDHWIQRRPPAGDPLRSSRRTPGIRRPSIFRRSRSLLPVALAGHPGEHPLRCGGASHAKKQSRQRIAAFECGDRPAEAGASRILRGTRPGMAQRGRSPPTRSPRLKKLSGASPIHPWHCSIWPTRKPRPASTNVPSSR